MVNFFNEKAFAEILVQMGNLDYRGNLLRKQYGFSDWFSGGTERTIPAAAFAHTPASYESAVIGVVAANSKRDADLVDQFRGLGAPVILEVDGNEIREWIVSQEKGKHALVQRFSADHIRQFFIDRTAFWKPHNLLRYKNIGDLPWTEQPSLFAGLVPELEDRIQDTLRPLLSRAMAETIAEYKRTAGREPRPDKVFKLIFSVLTAKVFADRKVNGFAGLDANSSRILTLLSDRYKDAELPRLLNPPAREMAVSHIWGVLDFRNLSVEVLAQMWSSMLIDQKTRRKLGIHRTSRTLVRYIVDKLKFRVPGDEKRIIFEPCTGSSAFLIGAMNRLRPTLFGMTPTERHAYFTKRLVGIESDPFGVEISKLALTLADFPNPGGWEINRDDVFRDGAMTSHLRKAGVVLCNPPFRDFDDDERPLYNLSSTHKPVELLRRILKDLDKSAELGFVLPRAFADGSYYKQIRSDLVARFANVDITILPDKAFDADTEPALLVATEPFPHNESRLVFSSVRDNLADWKLFESLHKVRSYPEQLVTPETASESLFIPDLPEVWKHLASNSVIGDIAEVHRGLEWEKKLTQDGLETGNRDHLVRDTASAGFKLGVAPKSKFSLFQRPNFRYLNFNKEEERGHSFDRQWDRPKVILNKSAKSRGHWRIAAFPDSKGVPFYQTFIGVWPTGSVWDEVLLSAVLNSPLANAFISTREGKTDVTLETLRKIPIPNLSYSQSERLRKLVVAYQKVIEGHGGLFQQAGDDPERLLLEIDALVLDGYKLPPRLEHEILAYFQGHNDKRPTTHAMGDYLPLDQESYFSLSTHISPKFQRATVGAMIRYLES